MSEEHEMDAPSPRRLEPESRQPIKLLGKRIPRLQLFYALYALLFVYLLGGMFYRQLIQSSEYRKMGDRQSLRRVLQPGPRGDIYDRNGNLLVGTRPRRSAVVYLEELRKEFQEAYFEQVRLKRQAGESVNRHELRSHARALVLQRYLDRINAIIGREEQVDVEDMARHFKQRLLLPLPLIRDLSPREYAQLTEQLPVNSPIQIYTDTARYYPYREAASHVLGYVGPSDDLPEAPLPGEELRTLTYKGLKGRAGLESAFDDRLSGQTGGKVWRVDPVGYQYELVKEQDSRRGERLITTLDVDLQQVAESALGYYRGAVVALDVETGEVLVMASKPNYDLNDLSPYIPQDVFDRIQQQGGWLNRAMQGRYQPGSTFKIITAIAAMRHAGIDPAEKFECGSYFAIGNWNAPEHGLNSFGMVDLPKALQKSSNVYCYQIALKTGIDDLEQEARRFGLGQETGLELPAENDGVVPSPEWKKNRLYEPWRPGDTANMSIGQGYLLATPLQMACFTASLARAETRTRPTLIHLPGRAPGSINHGGEPIGLTAYEYGKIVEGMEMAAGQEGTARRIQIPGVRIAAKTGTAQHRAHGRELTLAWTIAFAPVERPRIAIAVMVEGTNPDDNYHGGSTASPIARAVLEAFFRKYPQPSPSFDPFPGSLLE